MSIRRNQGRIGGECMIKNPLRLFDRKAFVLNQILMINITNYTGSLLMVKDELGFKDFEVFF